MKIYGLKYLVVFLFLVSLSACDDESSSDGTCGDGFLDIGEECDSGDLGNLECSDFGFYSGNLSCTDKCKINISACEGVCGDGIKNGNEECDKDDFGDLTCSKDYGYSGKLTCNNDCTVNISECLRCGDGVVQTDYSETCDGTDFGGATCASLGFTGGGELFCNECHIDTDTCLASLCGNNIKESDEICDGTDFGESSCRSENYFNGELTCNDSCLNYSNDTCRNFEQFGASSDDFGGKMTVDSTGNLYLTGYIAPESIDASHFLFVRKYDNIGKLLFETLVPFDSSVSPTDIEVSECTGKLYISYSLNAGPPIYSIFGKLMSLNLVDLSYNGVWDIGTTNETIPAILPDCTDHVYLITRKSSLTSDNYSTLKRFSVIMGQVTSSEELIESGIQVNAGDLLRSETDENLFFVIGYKDGIGNYNRLFVYAYHYDAGSFTKQESISNDTVVQAVNLVSKKALIRNGVIYVSAVSSDGTEYNRYPVIAEYDTVNDNVDYKIFTEAQTGYYNIAGLGMDGAGFLYFTGGYSETSDREVNQIFAYKISSSNLVKTDEIYITNYNQDEQAYDIIVDPADAVFITGYTVRSIEPGVQEGGKDIYVGRIHF